MLISLIALACGVIAAVVVISQFKRLSFDIAKYAYPTFLATLPVYYWGFSIHAGDNAVLLDEIIIGSVFIFAAYLAYRLSKPFGLMVLGIGFIGHAIYDVAHIMIDSHAEAPSWWPEFCGAADLVIGFYLLSQIKWKGINST